jgi:hypothetical protein
MHAWVHGIKESSVGASEQNRRVSDTFEPGRRRFAATLSQTYIRTHCMIQGIFA